MLTDDNSSLFVHLLLLLAIKLYPTRQSLTASFHSKAHPGEHATVHIAVSNYRYQQFVSVIVMNCHDLLNIEPPRLGLASVCKIAIS